MSILFDLTLLFAVAGVVLYISAKLKLPTIVGLLLSGLLVGPYGLGLVDAKSAVQEMADIGILLLLFTIGLEFSLKKLAETQRWIFIGGGLQVAITASVVCVLSLIVGMPWTQSLFIGFLFAMSSTAIVLHMLQEKGQMDTGYGKASLSVLIFQDIIIIPMMLVVPFLAGEGKESLGSALLTLGEGVLIVGVIILLARYLVPRLLRSIVRTRNQELFLLSVLVICFATAFTTYELGLKLALGAFLAGLMVSESEFSYDALSSILPLKKIFTSIFFVSVGMLLNTEFLISNLPLVLGVTAGVFVIKNLILIGTGILLRLPLRDALILGLGLSQVGEFAFILSETGNEYAILTQAQYQTFLAVSILSMAVSPFIITAAPRMADYLIARSLFDRWAKRMQLTLESEPEICCEDEGHLVIVGYGPNGRKLAHQAREKQMAYAIIELNEKNVAYARENDEPVYAGDAREMEVLERAGVPRAGTVAISIGDAAAAEAITAKVREINPSAFIIARTRFNAEVERLLQLGADEVITEEMLAGNQMQQVISGRMGMVS